MNKTADTLPKFQTDYMFIRKVAENKTQPCITFVGAEVPGKQYTDTSRDSHDAIRHKSRRTLAQSSQQCHLPFHPQFVTLDLCSQDSQCDPTAERHSSICSELHMFHLCACLVNRYSRVFPTMKCEQPS